MSREIGKNIRRLRTEKGMTQEELAQRLHVTRQAVSLWETGKSLPDVEMLQSVGELFEQDLQSLLGSVPTAGEKRRRALKIAGLAGVMALGLAVLLALEVLIQWGMNQWNVTLPILAMRLRSANVAVITPAVQCLWGWCGIRLVLHWAGRWPARRWQQWVLAAGAALCTVYFAAALIDELYIYGVPTIFRLHHWVSGINDRPGLFVIFGISLGQWPGRQAKVLQK